MKRWTGILLLVALLFSCEPDQKDDLEGKWQLLEVTARDGTVTRVDTVWYNIQNTLFMYQYYDAADEVKPYRYIYGYKSWRSEKEMAIELENYPLAITEFLPKTDWSSGNRLFEVIAVSGNKLILESEEKRYLFRKF